MDIALRRGVLQPFAPQPEYGSEYADMLFSGAIPTTTNFNEPVAFRHYLTCLRHQCQIARHSTFDETIEYHKDLLAGAARTIQFAHRYGVRGQKRDFEESIDANLTALDTFEAEKGFLIKRMWA